MIPYTLRPYTKDDFEFVYQAKKEAYQIYVEKFWGKWDEEKQRALFIDFIKKVQNSLAIIDDKGAPIGLYHGDIIDPTTYKIGNIIIIPSYQGKGIGTDILQNIIKKYPNFKMHLQVFKDNPAVNLYQRFGFVIINETRTHLIMEHM